MFIDVGSLSLCYQWPTVRSFSEVMY